MISPERNAAMIDKLGTAKCKRPPNYSAMSIDEIERLDLSALSYHEIVQLQGAVLSNTLAERVREPMSYQVAWSNPAAAIDQLRAVQGIRKLITIISGGNRSGKTHSLKMLACAYTLGADHPMIRTWIRINSIPRGMIPDGPAEIYLIAKSSNDSQRYHRKDIDAMLPPGNVKWFNRNGKGEASVEISVPGYKEKGKIWFKSMDQGPESFQGISLRACLVDEEPLGQNGKAVLAELKMRVADQGGKIIISMSPVTGYTWIYEDYVKGNDDDRIIERDECMVYALDSLDNPYGNVQALKNIYKGMTEDEIARRRFGKFRSSTGKIFAFEVGDLTRDGPGHVCTPFEIPPEWPRYCGMDYGLTAPTAVVWAAESPEGVLYIYREYYEPKVTYKVSARTCRLMQDSEEEIDLAWGDPASPMAILAFVEEGFPCHKAKKDVADSIDAVKERLNVTEDGTPTVKIFSDCSWSIAEMIGYSWNPRMKGEVPLKKNDHAVDAIRYLIYNLDLAQ